MKEKYIWGKTEQGKKWPEKLLNRELFSVYQSDALSLSFLYFFDQDIFPGLSLVSPFWVVGKC